MKRLTVAGPSSISGNIRLPGDKSIAHRACILGALSRSPLVIKNFPDNDDCRATVSCLAALGCRLRFTSASTLLVRGKGLRGLRRPRGPLHIRESATTFRLLTGLLAGQDFSSRLTAGSALSRRPMRRVTEPLRSMGARISSCARQRDEYPPLRIEPSSLRGIAYRARVASAQVKSAVLLAGLFARGWTTVSEPERTRDHTERMLALFGARLRKARSGISVEGGRELAAPRSFSIPGDISSAGFFVALGSCSRGSSVRIEGVSLNPTRTGMLAVMRRMGARLTITRERVLKNTEPFGSILIRSGTLAAVRVLKSEIPSLIDELPALMVCASMARGTSVFEGVQELRVKETDRIAAMCKNLRAMGAQIAVRKNGGREDVVIRGVPFLTGAKVSSFQDHRIAMSMAVAGLCARGRTTIDDVSCVSKSFPGFLTTLRSLTSRHSF